MESKMTTPARLSGETEVIQNHALSPSSYCFHCRHLLKPGDQKRMVPFQSWRYGKQKKKAKGNATLWFNAHVSGECKAGYETEG